MAVTERRGKPRELLVNPYTWPNGTPKKNAPPELLLLVGIANRLKAALASAQISGRQAAMDIGITPSTIYNILKGECWPELPTIAKLEKLLETDLWGDEHR